MWGFIAVVRRRSSRATPTSQAVLDLVAGQATLLGSGPDATDAIAGGRYSPCRGRRPPAGVPGLRLLLAESSLGPALVHHCGELLAAVELE